MTEPEGVAEVEMARGILERAAKLGGACEFLEETLEQTSFFQTAALLASALPGLRQQLSGPSLAQAWAEGRRMTLDQAIAYTCEMV